MDLDGTLLRPDGTVSARTMRALRAIQAAGCTLVLVTGRPLRSLLPVADELGCGGLAICYNGALVYDLGRRAIVKHTPCAPDIMHRLVVALRRAAPGVCFAFEIEQRFGCEPGYLALNPRLTTDEILQDDALALCRTPVTKLIARHPTMPRETLLEIARSVGGEAIIATHSGAPFVEVSAAGVDKACALREICAELGVDRRQVVAFGDMPNDVPMLRWVGYGVAVANAHPEALHAADAVAPSNAEDGVATVLKGLLATAAVRRQPGGCNPSTRTR